MATFDKPPLKVVVTGAAGQIGYALLPKLANGEVFGHDQPVVLSLLEIPRAVDALKGVVMELEDCAFPVLVGMIATTEPAVAFDGADVAVLVGGFPRLAGMERKDLIAKNSTIFKSMGEALSKYAKSTCKTLVVANPANTNCAIALACCKGKIPAKNFTCMTRLDHNRALAQIAKKCNVPVKCVQNVVIWGNHSSTQFPDVSNGFILKDNGEKVDIETAVNDTKFLREDFIQTVQQRGAAIIKARKMSSALSAANAACDHLRTWLVTGTKQGEIVSMGVVSRGHYSLKENIVFSLPVTCANGEYTVCDSFEINDFAREKLDKTEAELVEELASANAFLEGKE